MREKTRLFRSLLLESLETRTVFAADGFDGSLHFVTPDARFDITHHHNDGVQVSKIVITLGSYKRGDDFGGPRSREMPPKFHDFHDDHEALIPEGEGPGPGVATRPDRPSRPTNTIDLNPPTITFIPVAPPTNVPTIVLSTKPTPVSRIDNAPRIGSTPRADSDAATSTINPSSNVSGGSLGSDSLANTSLASRAALTLATQPANSQSSLLTASNLSTSNLSTLEPGWFGKTDASFDFSKSTSNDLTSGLTPSNRRADDFRFTRDAASAGDSILDPALVDRAIGVASLDKLLSDLANKHRQRETGHETESEHSNRNEFAHRRHLHDSQLAELAAAYAEGGLIAMTLNRENSPTDLDELATNLHCENKAWVASVGVFRAFESGELATTDIARKSIRANQATQSSDSIADLDEASESRFNPLLASSTIALGAMLFSLRRIRKSARLMYTKR